jgi:hypothetical protein
MIVLPSCKIVGVFGPVSSGKTFLITKWAEEQKRVLIFDATGEFISKEGYTCYFRNVKAVWTELQKSPWYFRIVYEPGRNLNNDFAWILSALWHTQSDKQFFVDEFHKICPVSINNEDVETMLRFARHDKLGFCGVSQRIADVHKLFTSSCRMIVLFHTQEARDLDAISDRWGTEVEKQITNLRPLIHDDVTGTTHQIPQCIVVERGQRPKVFDFKTDSYLKTIGAPLESLSIDENDDSSNSSELDE